jgi:uncharacterized membrane protein
MTRNPLCLALALAPALVLAACGAGDATPEAPQATPSDVSATATPSPSPSESVPAIPTEYVAGGNEPFWSIATHADRVVYSSPEEPDGESLPATVSQADGWTRFAAQMDGAPLVLEVRKAACEDDMSGLPFSHESRLTRGAGTFRGCARLASEPRPSE